MKLIISEYTKIIAKNIKVNKEEQVDVFDVIELAIEIGEDNNIYSDGNWNDTNRDKCYAKAYEII